MLFFFHRRHFPRNCFCFYEIERICGCADPPGGAGLIRAVVENSTIPVIETGTGNCHIYVDETADLTMAAEIILNAKTQRVGVCNACESLLVHKKVAEKLLPALAKRLTEKQVELRGDEEVQRLVKEAVPASEEDWGKEYLHYILSHQNRFLCRGGDCSYQSLQYRLIRKQSSRKHTHARISGWVVAACFSCAMLPPASPMGLIRVRCGNWHQHTKTSCPGTYGTAGSYDYQIHYLWKWSDPFLKFNKATNILGGCRVQDYSEILIYISEYV